MARGMGAEWLYREAVGQRRFWTPAQDLPIWYDVGELSTLSGDMQTLQDRGGTSLSVSQATSGTRPGLAVDALSGLPVLTFSGSQDMAAASAADWKFLHDTTGSTIAIVVQSGTSSNPNALSGWVGTSAGGSAVHGYSIYYDDRSASSANNALVMTVSRGVGGVWTVNSTQNDRVTPNQLNTAVALMDPGNGTAANRARASINGGTFSGANSVTNAASSANPAYTLGIGQLGGGNFRLTGNIAEIIIYRRLFASVEAEGLQGYQHHRWNRTYLLPATHRFRNRPRLIGEA